MKLCTVLVVALGCLFPEPFSVDAFRQCDPDRKCVPFNDCPDFRSYVGTPSSTWPRTVQNAVRAQLCGVDQPAAGQKVYKVCCSKPGRHLLDLESCGKQVTPRIAHGKIAAVFQFPWMALLKGFDGKFHCGGTLIAKRYVLTATHCRRKKVHSVRLGETDLSTPIDCNRYLDEDDCAEEPQDILVEKFIHHPKYSISQKKNDIALIRLASPAQLNDNVRPICLPLPAVSLGATTPKMVVTGWGFTEESESETSLQLRYASVPIVDLRQCNDTLVRIGSAWTVDESQVCAGAGADKADNCQGDSGGPLQYADNGRFVIHGVISFGQASCGTESDPGIYAKVYHYLDWIIDNLL